MHRSTLSRAVLFPFLLAWFSLADVVWLDADTSASGGSSDAQPAQVDVPPQTRAWSWRFVAGGATVGSGAFDSDGRYYFAADDRYLYALGSDGTMAWRTDLGRRPSGGVVIGTDGTILVPLDDGELIALNRDGRLIWRDRVTQDRVLAPVVLASGLVVTVRAPGILEARSHTGRFVWQVDVGSLVSCAPILDPSGELAVATTDGSLVAVTVDGRLGRRRYVGQVASVIIAHGEGIALGSTSGSVVVADAAFEPVWRADLGSAVRELRSAATGDLYATLDDGSLSRLTSEGVRAWSVAPGSVAVRTPLVKDDLVFVTSDGVLTRLSRDGTTEWQMRLPDRPTGLERATYGALVITTASWVTYAYPYAFATAGSWPLERGAEDRRGVSRGADSGRVDLSAFSQSADYLALRTMLLAGGESEQAVAMSRIASRAAGGTNLAGEYSYLLGLCEQVAGSPYFGPLTQFGPQSAPRRAREQAVTVLGQIGDLTSGRFLARLLLSEPDTAMQATILESMGRLGTPVDEALAARLEDLVRRDVARGPTDTLGSAISRFVGAVAAYRGGYVDPHVVDVLLLIAGSSYGRQTRTLALDTLHSLAGGGSP